MTRISVAMATYNGEQFLAEQLRSIAGQTRQPDELVVTDDHSSDRTIDILRSFAASAPFPLAIHENAKRLGFTGNFERALSLCTGDLIFISDQDDIWYPDKIERVVDTLSGGARKLAVIHDQHLVDARGRRYPTTYMQNVAAVGYSGRELQSGNCTAFDARLMAILQPFPDVTFYDAWINLVADLLQGRVILREPLQSYRRHEANATGSAVTDERPSRWRTFLGQGMTDPRTGWKWNIDRLRAALERIDERRAAVEELVGKEGAEAAIARAEQEILAFERRLALTRTPRWRRWAAILPAWRSGAYDEFSGLRSALVDMVRR